ncbi:biotin/lipoyl-containing protein [Bizionia sediminis]|uniref:Biotin/lipoyl-containing protein n=1 Tax=Bizionia sediminis TaxID=1737064 RepID=A0ABW5KWH7_9FLAO
MSKTYQTTVNNNQVFKMTPKNVTKLDYVHEAANTYHVLHENKSYKIAIVKQDFQTKQYQVKVNGTTYNVAIEDPLDLLIKDLGFEIGASKQINDITAPMPGLILDIAVTAGQEVQENDTILILEAMKMENVITAPRSGIIKSVSVKPNDAVDKNQLLISFE